MSQLGMPLPVMKRSDERQLCLTTGRELAGKGYWADAVTQYRRAEALAPRKPKLDAELAPALAACGEYMESIERYRRMVKASPKDWDLRNNFAWTLMESGNCAEAESEWRSILAKAPSYQRAQMNLGIALAKQRKYDEAYAQLEPILGEAAAHHNVGVIAIDIGDEHTAKLALEQSVKCRDSLRESHQLLAALQPPATAPQIMKGSAPDRTASGTLVSTGSWDTSFEQTK